eukprot:4290572-Prymnesium_polylepis.1
MGAHCAPAGGGSGRALRAHEIVCVWVAHAWHDGAGAEVTLVCTASGAVVEGAECAAPDCPHGV